MLHLLSAEDAEGRGELQLLHLLIRGGSGSGGGALHGGRGTAGRWSVDWDGWWGRRHCWLETLLGKSEHGGEPGRGVAGAQPLHKEGRLRPTAKKQGIGKIAGDRDEKALH